MPRRLGQHFLKRRRILECIAQAACPRIEPLVIEIGAGRGELTEHLLTRSQRLVAIEADPELAARLNERFAGDDRLTVLVGDVLSTDLGQWGPAVVAGNLPYYISSPILERILALGPSLKRAAVLLQREVAERLAARPGTRAYGLLSVRVQLVALPEILLHAPPSAFSPPPKVDSALVRLTPLAATLLEWAEQPGFLRFAAACFRFKRKTLRNNLAPLYGPRLEGLPEASLRAEQLSVAELIALYRALQSRP